MLKAMLQANLLRSHLRILIEIFTIQISVQKISLKSTHYNLSLLNESTKSRATPPENLSRVAKR